MEENPLFPKSIPVIPCPDVRLRMTTAADLGDIYRLFEFEDIAHEFLITEGRHEQLEQYLSFALEKNKAGGMMEIGGGVYYIGAHYVIEIRTDEGAPPQTIGFIECKGRPYSDPKEKMDVVEVTYAMHPVMRRKGLTSLALYVLSEYILEHVGGYDAVHLNILTSNLASAAVASACGFTRKEGFFCLDEKRNRTHTMWFKRQTTDPNELWQRGVNAMMRHDFENMAQFMLRLDKMGCAPAGLPQSEVKFAIGVAYYHKGDNTLAKKYVEEAYEMGKRGVEIDHLRKKL